MLHLQNSSILCMWNYEQLLFSQLKMVAQYYYLDVAHFLLWLHANDWSYLFWLHASDWSYLFGLTLSKFGPT